MKYTWTRFFNERFFPALLIGGAATLMLKNVGWSWLESVSLPFAGTAFFILLSLIYWMSERNIEEFKDEWEEHRRTHLLKFTVKKMDIVGYHLNTYFSYETNDLMHKVLIYEDLKSTGSITKIPAKLVKKIEKVVV